MHSHVLNICFSDSLFVEYRGMYLAVFEVSNDRNTLRPVTMGYEYHD